MAQPDSLRGYFSKIFEADDSGEEFPVNLERVWRAGYSRKDAAARALQAKFEEGVAYHSFHRIVERENGRYYGRGTSLSEPYEFCL